MTYTINGSRIADSSRVALAAIDVDHTLASKCVDLILAAGMSALGGSCHRCDPHEWQWRRAGGTFANIGATGELKRVDAAGDTVLCNNTSVPNADRRANAGGTFVASGREFENGANPLNSGCRVRNCDVTETQFGICMRGAIDNQQYEFQVIWGPGGCPPETTSLISPAKVSTPAVAGAAPPFPLVINPGLAF